MKYSLEHIREVFFWSLEARDIEMLRYLLHPSFNFCLKGEVITYSEFLMRIEKRRFLFLQNFSAKSAIALPVKKIVNSALFLFATASSQKL